MPNQQHPAHYSIIWKRKIDRQLQELADELNKLPGFDINWSHVTRMKGASLELGYLIESIREGRTGPRMGYPPD